MTLHELSGPAIDSHAQQVLALLSQLDERGKREALWMLGGFVHGYEPRNSIATIYEWPASEGTRRTRERPRNRVAPADKV